MIATCVSSSHGIVSAPDAGAPSAPTRETWYVATSSGTRAMTLDELDEAVERGEVDTSTPLWIPGMAEWEALGSVANFEDGSPLESTPGAMLEYGLDAERALAEADGNLRSAASDMRDYDPFSFPPPAPNIPDPNGALWASILPPSPPTGARRSIEPWWRGDGGVPWASLMLSGTLVLCLSLLAITCPHTSAPADEVQASADSPLHAETRALAPQPSLASERGAPSAVVASSATSALIRYDEPEQRPRALADSPPIAKAVGKLEASRRAAVTKRAARRVGRR